MEQPVEMRKTACFLARLVGAAIVKPGVPLRRGLPPSFNADRKCAGVTRCEDEQQEVRGPCQTPHDGAFFKHP